MARASPTMCANGWRCSSAAPSLPAPDRLLIETFPREGRHYMVVYSFEGWNAHQSLGMLVTRRMESAGLQPIGFVASDYAIATYSLQPVTDPRPLFSPDILEHEFVDWVQESALLKRAFREVAVIGGLVERQHPGQRKTGRQVSFSTDLIYDVLRRYEPDHLLLRGRLGRCARADDRCRPARPPARHRARSGSSMSRSTGSRRSRCRCWC